MHGRSSLLKNTAMLYILVGSNYFLGLVTIPYLTRVLGPEAYGSVGFAQAVSVYVQLALDFGFILSATEEVAKASDNQERVSQVFSSVTISKGILCVLSAAIIAVLCSVIPEFAAQWKLIFLFFLYVSVNSFLPDFVYRGLERMTAITVRAVAVKALFVLLIFIFVHNQDDYLLVPICYLVGAVFALVIVLGHIHFKLGVCFVRVEMKEVLTAIKASCPFFLSRIATTFYSSLNLVIVGFLYPSSAVLGCYTATDKAISAGKAASSPVADSMYPYMIRTKNYRLLLIVAGAGFAALVAICIPVYIWAEPVCILAFGQEYASAAPLLRLLLPVVPLALIAYLFGFPALSPLGKAGFANVSVIMAAGLQCILLILVWQFGFLSAESICVITVITESFVAFSRMIVFFRGRIA